MGRRCSFQGCGGPHYAKGFCNMHWSRLRRHGDPSVVKPGNVTHHQAGRGNGDRTLEYRSWEAMKQRCLNSKCTTFANYGGRGIRIHPPWISSFAAFFAHVGPAPSPRHTLDRFPDNNGHYEPGNVRWATKKEQANNRRPARRRSVAA